MTSPNIPTWKKAAYAATTCILFFLMLEVVLWLCGVNTILDRHDPWRGFSGMINVFERDGDVYRTRRFEDHWTFNSQSFSAEKQDDAIRIFCLGGSSAYGYPWGADAAFTAILGEALSAAHPQRTVEAVNASGVSYGIHRLRLLTPEILSYEPDILIIYSGHNEFIEPTFFQSLKEQSAPRRRFEFVLAHSRFYSAIRQWSSHRSEDSDDESDDHALIALRDDSIVYTQAEKDAILAEFEATLDDLVRLAQTKGVKVVLATVPCNMRWRPHRSDFGKSLTRDQRRHWQHALENADRALAAEDASEAIVQLEAALEIAPTHAGAHYRLGEAHELREQWQLAREAYRAACDLDASPQRRLTGVNDAIRRVARRCDALLVDVDQNFQDESLHGVIGFDLIEDYVHPSLMGHRQIAWQLLQAIEQAQWLGAPAHIEREAFDQMASNRDTTVTAANARWYCNQAVVLVNQKHIEKAVATLREAAVLFPADANVQWRLASLLASQEELPEAAHHYELALQLDPQAAGGWMNLGVIYERMGDLPRAEANLQRSVQLDPQNAVAHYNLGVVLQKGGQVAAARSHFVAALRIQPSFREAQARLSQLPR